MQAISAPCAAGSAAAGSPNRSAMSRSASDNLFRLIKSLSPSEKRYFKLFINGREGRENKYIVLFEAIEAQVDFDDAALRDLIYTEEEIRSRKFSELKAYLYDLILKSLQGFDEKSSVDYRLRALMLGVRVLCKRSLLEDARGQLARAQKLATHYERFDVLLEIYEWEKQIAYAQTDMAWLEAQLPALAMAEAEALRQQGYYAQSRNMFFRLLANLRKDPSLRGAAAWQQALEDDLDWTLLDELAENGAHLSKILRYRILTVYCYAVGDLVQFHAYGRQLIALMESKPHFIKEDASDYIAAISNYIRSCGELKRFGEIAAALEKLRGIAPQTADDEWKIYRQYYQNKFALCIATGEFEEGMVALDAHLSTRDRFDTRFFEHHAFYYSYFYICFGAGFYDRALHFLNEWLSLDDDADRADLKAVAHILNVIVHFELGNYLLIESLTRSTSRFLKKRDKFHDMERKLLAFVKAAADRKYMDSDVRPAAKAFLRKFEAIKDEPLSQLITTRFNIGAWLESKVSGRPFAAVAKEQYLAWEAKRRAGEAS